MIIIDMWYGNDYKNCDMIDIIFYPNYGKYKGNIYLHNKIIGDFTCDNSIELEKKFSHLSFNWN